MRRSTNPALAYLRLRRWTWVSNRELCSRTGCSQAHVDATMIRSAQIRTVEVTGEGAQREYRYIGNGANPMRRAVEFLRDIYPQWASVRQIATGSDTDVVGLLRRYTDVLPVEECRNGHSIRYRYVPGDRRSLRADSPPMTSAKPCFGEVRP